MIFFYCAKFIIFTYTYISQVSQVSRNCSTRVEINVKGLLNTFNTAYLELAEVANVLCK